MFGFQKKYDFKRRGSFKRQKMSCRADAVLAPAAEQSAGLTIAAKNFNQHAVFCSLAANRSTCSIRISSVKQKSRAIIILFRGRVLSCVYGKRGAGEYLFGKDAFARAQIDLLQQAADFSVHTLSEDAALSASSYFEGEQRDQPAHTQAQDFFSKTSRTINSYSAPGCFVVRDNEKNTTCVIYFFGGEITGIYSYERGWLKDNRYETAIKAISEKSTCATSAFMMPSYSLAEIYDITFNLTGTIDSEADKMEWINADMSGIGGVTPLQLFAQKPSGLRDTFACDMKTTYQAALAEVNNYALRQARQHGHSIDPSKYKAS